MKEGLYNIIIFRKEKDGICNEFYSFPLSDIISSPLIMIYLAYSLINLNTPKYNISHKHINE